MDKTINKMHEDNVLVTHTHTRARANDLAGQDGSGCLS